MVRLAATAAQPCTEAEGRFDSRGEALGRIRRGVMEQPAGVCEHALRARGRTIEIAIVDDAAMSTVLRTLRNLRKAGIKVCCCCWPSGFGRTLLTR